MKLVILSLFAFTSSLAFSATTMKWNHPKIELAQAIQEYAKATNTSFVVDTTVRGTVAMINPSPISTEEVFKQLSKALAINGYSWVKVDGKYYVRSARNIQRDSMTVYTELPPIEPEHMVTYIYQCPAQKLNCENLLRDVRILLSAHGEMSSVSEKNSLVINDFTGNIQRIHSTLEKLAALPNQQGPKK